MKIKFWEQRWDEGSIGFHLSEVNPYLLEYWSHMNTAKGSTVLVPMCGKSLDLMWFVSQGFNVLGVECSKKAINEFSNEQKIDLQIKQHKNFVVHSNHNITVLEGDFFKLDREDLSNVSTIYDRASLIALPEDMRKQYVETLANNLPKHVSILLVVIEYKQSVMSGPPFSVSSDEIERLYKPHFLIENIYEQDVIDEQPRFKQRGLGSMIERVFKISR